MENELNSYKVEWVMKSVQQAMNTISHRVTNTALVERRIIRQVGSYLTKSVGNKYNRRFITKIIYREINESLKRNNREYAGFLEDLKTSNDDGQEVEYEPVDVLANVESDVIVKETITLLAKDDRRKEMILNAWADGCTDDTEISNFLAEVLTGQATGHLSFIKRFRKTCKAELSAQYVC